MTKKKTRIERELEACRDMPYDPSFGKNWIPSDTMTDEERHIINDIKYQERLERERSGRKYHVEERD